MPELWNHGVGDCTGRAFLLGEALQEQAVHAAVVDGESTRHQQPYFDDAATAYESIMLKPSIQEKLKLHYSMTTMLQPHHHHRHHYHHHQHLHQHQQQYESKEEVQDGLAQDSDRMLLRAPSSLVPPMVPDIYPLLYSSCVPHNPLQQHLQITGNVPGPENVDVPEIVDVPEMVDVPEIEETSTWMSEILNDFPAIAAPGQDQASFARGLAEVGAGVGTGVGAAITSLNCGNSSNPVSSSAIHLPISIVASGASSDEHQSGETPPPTGSSLNASGGSSPSVTVTDSDNVAKLSPTPKVLKARALRKPGRGAAESLTKRAAANFDPLEHVRREKERRDDFSSKISTLECLLPVAAHTFKRDRASIVHDSVAHVRFLQGQVAELQKTFSHLKLSRSSPAIASSRPRQQQHQNQHQEQEQPPPHSGTVSRRQIAVSCSARNGDARFVEYHIEVQGAPGQSAAKLDKCKCRPDFMSGTMKVLECMNLDVCRCTITKMLDYTICVIIAKPRLTSNVREVTSASVATALKSSLALL